MDALFARWNRSTSPGCAVSVMRRGKIVLKRGYGMANLEHGIPIEPSTPFHVASLSKQFTAMAVALLVDQGRLSWDDDVRRYVPEVPDFGAPITVRHLIHHTSGLRDQWDLLEMAGWRLESDLVTEADVLHLVSQQATLNFPPGRRHLYSNTGYTLLALIVRRATGRSLAEVAEEQIFRPLGMRRTRFQDQYQGLVPRRAYAYAPLPGGSFRVSMPNYHLVGATNAFSSVEDIARWDRNFYAAEVGGPAVVRQLGEPAVLADGDSVPYGLGLQLGTYRGLPIVEHGGSDAGYRSHFLRFPGAQLSVAVLCNLAGTEPGGLARRVADLYLADQLAPEPGEQPAVDLSQEELGRLAGVYRHRESDLAWRIDLRDGRLTLDAGPGLPLSALGDGRFRLAGSEVTLSLAVPEDGAGPRLRFERGYEEIVYDWVESADPSPQELAEYAGTYYSLELAAAYSVTVEDAELVLGPDSKLYFTTSRIHEGAAPKGQYGIYRISLPK